MQEFRGSIKQYRYSAVWEQLTDMNMMTHPGTTITVGDAVDAVADEDDGTPGRSIMPTDSRVSHKQIT